MFRLSLAKSATIAGFTGLIGLMVAAYAAYALSSMRLSEARRARHEADYGLAEMKLASCWPLPGLRESIDMESQLAAVQQGDLRDEKKWQSLAERKPIQRTLILESLAEGYLAAFQWPEAQHHAQLILSQEPKHARALWLRGRALVEMQQETQALSDFQQACQAEPGSVNLGRSLASLLHKLGYIQLAIEQYQRLNQLKPNDPNTLLALAHCFQEQSNHEAAQELVDQVLASNPNSVAALVERGRLSLRRGEPANAEQWVRRAMTIAPQHADARRVLRLALQAQTKVDSAFDLQTEQQELRQAELKRQLEKHAHDPDVLTSIGQWMMQTGAEDEVPGWLYAALKRDPKHGPAHLALFEFYSQRGQTRRAASHARQASVEIARDIQSPVATNPSPSTKAPATKKASSKEVAARWLDKQVTTGVGTGGSTSEHEIEATHEEVHRLCAACHAYPDPATMPRATWRKEVKQGFDFLRDSNLAIEHPALERVVAYYERRAAESLPAIKQPVTDPKPWLEFERRGTGYMPRLPPAPGVTNALLAGLQGGTQLQLLLCETRQNALMILNPYDSKPGGVIIPQVPTACHTTVCDLNRDGHQDILVASIGSFFPTDDKLGQVLWLAGQPNGQFRAVPLLSGLGRVTDVQAADFDADDQLDLVVAVYGWRSTGEILYLENQTQDWSQPKFQKHVVDARHGAIHVPVVDLNRDGRADFVGLISQEHESVVAYLNDGGGEFETKLLYAAPHPSYGCTGIELVDLDNDQDLDVLLSNGDILDPPYLLKPYHGIQWLENTGSHPFLHHHVGAMAGAARATAADFDGDGDQDIAAVSFLPSMHFPDRDKLRLPSVAIYEQTDRTRFEMHVLETASCDHFSCAAGDWDNDGRPDLAITNFSWNGSQAIPDAATLWRNKPR